MPSTDERKGKVDPTEGRCHKKVTQSHSTFHAGPVGEGEEGTWVTGEEAQRENLGGVMKSGVRPTPTFTSHQISLSPRFLPFDHTSFFPAKNCSC